MEPYSRPAVFITFYIVLLTDFILLKHVIRQGNPSIDVFKWYSFQN